MSTSELYFWNQVSWDEEGEKLVQKRDEVRELATSIRNRFETLPPLSSRCCIYRIPQTLREANKWAYSPCLVSIGPFHRGKKKLQPMQEKKLRYLENFLRRGENRNLSEYLRFIRQWEKEAREFYVETVHLSFEEFVEMVLLDGIFLIEFLLVWHFDDADETDRIFERPSLECVIKRDILLLENQLPFFILDGLYDIAFGNVESLPSLRELCSQVLTMGPGRNELPEDFPDCEILHLVDFLRTYYLPSVLRDPNNDNVDHHHSDHFDFPPGLEMLYDAGVRFEVAKDTPLLDITFSNGVLRIPKLEVEDNTESLLLNLSAFEQCHYFYDSYILDYVVLMDVLITTLRDVGILINNGIVANSLGSSDDLAEIFNTICSGTTYQARGFYYYRLCKKLNAHAKAPWNRWRATLKHDYFSNPWTIISVIVAVVLLILTVIQTVCTVISMD